MSSKLPSKSVATAAVTQSIRSASKSVKTSTELVWTYIRGSNIEIREVHDNNYPVVGQQLLLLLLTYVLSFPVVLVADCCWMHDMLYKLYGMGRLCSVLLQK